MKIKYLKKDIKLSIKKALYFNVIKKDYIFDFMTNYLLLENHLSIFIFNMHKLLCSNNKK
jgi:hypothetical protein